MRNETKPERPDASGAALSTQFGATRRPSGLKTEWQGKAVVEFHGGEYLMMFPDGTVGMEISKADAEARARKWFAAHGMKDAFRVGMIEWRQ
jgi:hypothetical protein